MVGLFAMSMIAGQLLARGWRYNIFPRVGTAVMTVGLALLGTISATTSGLVIAVYMVILGAGLGAVMQILVVAVQNAVDIRDLGTSTAAANFFRSMGGSFGTAVFGAVYSNVLPIRLASNAAAAGGVVHIPPAEQWTPEILQHLDHTTLHVIVTSIAEAIHMVFRYTLPFGVLAFLLSLTLPHVTLKGRGPAESLGAVQE
jgi:MFS family permease